MSDIICVTDRRRAGDLRGFLTRVEEIAAARPAGLILREKDLTEDAYKKLAVQVLDLCRVYGTTCILHDFVRVCADLGCADVHLPLPVLSRLPQKEREVFKRLGASCHSVEEAVRAEALGCTYITAGHIFETDCKKGLPGRGLGFLRKVCARVSIPVYAIGGISAGNIGDVRRCGAAGACVMSGVMDCEDVKRYLDRFQIKDIQRADGL